MNGKRSVLAFSVCWVLSCVSWVNSAKACGCSGDPPGDPDCCLCEDGVWVCQCDDGPDCGTCWECVEGCCVSCWCWDDGAPISGQIDAPATCALCQQVGFGADVNDYDHWVSGWGYEQSPKDSIGSYSWSTNPPVGEWLSEQGFKTRDWQAPPCLQTVEIRLEVDDKPDPAYGGCYGHMDRDDPSKLFTTTIEVVLPPDCSTGVANIEMRWTNGSEEDACQSSGTCGNNRWDRIGCGTYYRGVYNNCAWEPQFDIYTEGYWWGVCTDNFQDWDCGSPGVVDADNYCERYCQMLWMKILAP